ncbi:DNA topoisomerase 1 isoform X1 [Macadamia integrifolia]|uniref:DNA topoisomerase 1 isoform X1 n=1 Tax=Macadamia integrifolia TaxID=60698 RepID=UPI001C4FA24E|nr:DNA topoisomerase 1 isoform X1 [Macadamia integrifolia]
MLAEKSKPIANPLMALQPHRLFSMGCLHGNFTCSSLLPSMPQCRPFRNYPGTCFPYTLCGDSSKFRRMRESCRVAANQLKDLSFKVEQERYIFRSLSDGFRHGTSYTFQSQFRVGFPCTVNPMNTLRYSNKNFGSNSSSCQYVGRGFSSVHPIEKPQESRNSVNRNDNLALGVGNNGVHNFPDKKVRKPPKRTKSLVAHGRSHDGNIQASDSSRALKMSASNASKTTANIRDAVKLDEKVTEDALQDVKAGSSVNFSSKRSSKHQEANTERQKMQQSRSKKRGELSGAISSSVGTKAKGSKKSTLVEQRNAAKATQSSTASKNLPAEESQAAPLAVVSTLRSTDDKSTKSESNAKSTKTGKSQKKNTITKSSKASLRKSNRPVQDSSSGESPKAQKLLDEGKIRPFGSTLKPLYPPTGKSVVVVESLTKAKVIQGYLGDMFEVLPSYGHVRDLAGRSGSVRPDNDFSMVWEVPSAAWTHLKSIKVALNGAENLILASDPDREGEAIAWHISEMLLQQDALHERIIVARVVFHEITESSIKSALQSPRDIDVDLVHAYLARRALDYLIGFNISPLLWRKLPACQSAGRVQSAALALICDREMEMDEFKPHEYWTVDVEFNKEPGSLDNASSLTSHLTHFDSKKLEQLSISSHIEAKSIEQKITSSNFEVVRSKRSQVRKNPPTPYITSTLQQDAANKLHFTATYTMKLAQKLYEGVKLSNEQATGLITYMRTDGLHVSNEAAEDIHSMVMERYGLDFASERPRKYFKKVKNAQEAHEAIRPTSIRRLPSMLVGILDEDSLKLYTLIWTRTMASQMEPTVIDQIQLDIGGDGESIFRSTCSRINFIGYQAVYKDTEAAPLGYEEKERDAREELFEVLSALKSGDRLYLGKVELKQHFTQPPPRYSEGSLVKKLEELGIGRPSTYASIMKVLQDRNYVTVKNRVLYPEFRGRMVSAFLAHHFSEVMDYSFTADMETELDNVSAGVTEWKGLLKDYWTRFSMYCEHAANLNPRQVEKMLEETFGNFLFASLPNRTCPSCSTGTLVFKVSRIGAGYFIGCNEHPKCKYIARTMYGDDEEDDTSEKQAVITEPKLLGLKPGTNEKVFLKNGPYGFYVQLGEDRKGYLPKRASVSQIKDVDTITLEQALELLQYPVLLGEHPEDGQPIYLKLARYGFSIRHRRTIGPVPKNMNPKDITLEKALKLLLGKHVRRCGRPKSKPKVEV